jgi:hypothetical protein
MNTRGIVVALVLLTLVCVSFSSADAACVVSGKVFYIGVPTGAGNATVYIAPASGALWTYYYVYTIPTTSPAGIASLQTAMAGQLTVQVTGTAASCPTTGTARSGGAIATVSTYISK